MSQVDPSSVATPPTGAWAQVESTSLAGKLTGKISKGTIIKTQSGGIYEVDDYIYLYEYVYYAPVIVLSDGGRYKLIIEGISTPLNCKQLVASAGPTGGASAAQPAQTPRIIESRIEDDFDGLEMDKVFRLQNGQVWQQTDAYIWIYIAVYPKVTIWHDGISYKMKVEGIDHAVSVIPLRQ